jgi:hypothetical protein
MTPSPFVSTSLMIFFHFSSSSVSEIIEGDFFSKVLYVLRLNDDCFADAAEEGRAILNSSMSIVPSPFVSNILNA